MKLLAYLRLTRPANLVTAMADILAAANPAAFGHAGRIRALATQLVTAAGQGGSSGRQIYEVAEPDPETTTTVHATRYNYAYPDRSTNTEAAFTWDNQLVLASKNFPTRLYRFAEPTDGGRDSAGGRAP